MSDLILNQGELIVKKTGGKEYVGIGRGSAWLTLTNQRLVIQRVSSGSSDYPLAHVTKASQYEHWPTQTAIVPFKLLRVDFDNGGAIIFGLSDLPGWIEAIEQTRVNAPQLPYTVAPAAPQLAQPADLSGFRLRWVIIALLVFSLFMVCLCTPLLFWILLK